MEKEEKVYIIGHKNPDSDSICSAIGYADFKNKIDKKIFIFLPKPEKLTVKPN